MIVDIIASAHAVGNGSCVKGRAAQTYSPRVPRLGERFKSRETLGNDHWSDCASADVCNEAAEFPFSDADYNQLLSDILTNTESQSAHVTSNFPGDSLTNPDDSLTTKKTRKSFRRDVETLEFVRLSAWPKSEPVIDASINRGIHAPFPSKFDRENSLQKHSTPPLWRDMTDRFRAALYHQVVITSGSGLGFDFVLSERLVAKAMSDNCSPLYLVAQKVAKDWQRATGHIPEWWAVLEKGEEGAFHIHGGIITEGMKKQMVTNILRQSARDEDADYWARSNTDVGWAWYSTKEFGSLDIIPDGLLHASRSLRQRTETAYGVWRELYGK